MVFVGVRGSQRWCWFTAQPVGKWPPPSLRGWHYRRCAADRSGEARTNPAGGHFLQIPTREVPLEWTCLSQAGDASDVDEGGGCGLGFPLVLCVGG